MTREEAIGRIKDHMIAHHMGEYPHIRIKEALDLALAALRFPTREMVERMRGEWKAVPKIGVYDTTCSKCGYAPGIRFFYSDFCPACGSPMTDEAVEMVIERLNKLEETKK